MLRSFQSSAVGSRIYGSGFQGFGCYKSFYSPVEVGVGRRELLKVGVRTQASKTKSFFLGLGNPEA